MAIATMPTSPTPKRIICGSAQGWTEPPATEKSMRKPAQATAVRSSTSGQLSARSFAGPRGTPLRRRSVEEGHARSRPGAAAGASAAGAGIAARCSSIALRCSAG